MIQERLIVYGALTIIVGAMGVTIHTNNQITTLEDDHVEVVEMIENQDIELPPDVSDEYTLVPIMNEESTSLQEETPYIPNIRILPNNDVVEVDATGNTILKYLYIAPKEIQVTDVVEPEEVIAPEPTPTPEPITNTNVFGNPYEVSRYTNLNSGETYVFASDINNPDSVRNKERGFRTRCLFPSESATERRAVFINTRFVEDRVLSDINERDHGRGEYICTFYLNPKIDDGNIVSFDAKSKDIVFVL